MIDSKRKLGDEGGLYVIEGGSGPSRQEQLEVDVALDLSRYIIGLKLSSLDVKKLHASIIYKLKKHHYNGSLAHLDELDIMQTVCEKIISGKRNWNKDKYTTPFEFVWGCASSIISAEAKLKSNKVPENGVYEPDCAIDINAKQPVEYVIEEEDKSNIMSIIVNSKPSLKALAEQVIFGENSDPKSLANSLKTTDTDVKNKKRALRRFLEKYLKRSS